MSLVLAPVGASLSCAMVVEPTATLVVVDEDAQSVEEIQQLLASDGYRVLAAAGGLAGLGLLDETVDVVIADLNMADMGGIELVERGRTLAPHAVFMVMTRSGAIDSAVQAIKRGAEQYLVKPLDFNALRALLHPAVLRASQHRELFKLRAAQAWSRVHRDILGDSPLIQRVLKLVERVAPSRSSVLISGESGTGKELIARALHEKSGRGGEFVALNCAALAETVLESELFGHERGAFTGALQRRDGRFKQADRGTLFLDEVSEIPPNVQVKLLRFLQEREYQRVGSNRTERVDVRVVAACNRDLRRHVEAGRFREDLFFRLNVVDIDIPPLRARLSDLPLLAEHFVKAAAVDNGLEQSPRISAEVMDRLLAYHWPGNVRELQNAMERAVVVCDGPEIRVLDLPAVLQDEQLGKDPRLAIPGMTLAELEKRAVLQTLEAVNWSPMKAADLLGVSTRTIQYRLKEWGIDRAQLSERGAPKDKLDTLF